MENESFQPPCWAGQQAIGTVFGTMFGFASAAILTPTNGEHTDGMPAAPGVILGSALGVLAANSSGDGNIPQLVYVVLGVGASAAATAAFCWLAGEHINEAGSMGIVSLAGAASLACTIVFAVRNHNTSVAAYSADTYNSNRNWNLLPQTDKLEILTDPTKEV